MRKRATEANESPSTSPIYENDGNGKHARGAERFSSLFSSGSDEDDHGRTASFDSNSSSSSEELDAADFVRATYGVHVKDQTLDKAQQASTSNERSRDDDSDVHASKGRPGADRPSTKQAAASRRLLDDEYDDHQEGMPGGLSQHSQRYAVEKDETSSSDEEDLVEIRALRAG